MTRPEKATEPARTPYRSIQVGTGGMGAHWCRGLLPPFIAERRIDVVAAVDTDRNALENARAGLGLERDRCYTDLSTALGEHPADICTIVVPPAFHEEVVDAALDHGLHILSEKPIADSLAASVRIADRVEAADRKMSLTMSHRFDQDKTTFREELRAARNGRLDYLVCRFTSAHRKLDSWGAFRHRMAEPLLIEGAVHHLDILVDLAGSLCATVSASTWNPPWGQYRGASEGIVLLEFANGVHAVYEGATCTAVGLNGWGQEYFRAECENATLVLDRRTVERFTPDQAAESGGPEGVRIPLLRAERWGHLRLIDDFLNWLDGGPEAPTSVRANLHATAVMFAAVESSRTRRVIDVGELLDETRASNAITGQRSRGERK